MINLASAQHKEDSRFVKIKSGVIKGTTALLVFWSLVVGGVFGWSWYVNFSGSRVEAEIRNLQSQVDARSEDEVLYRTVSGRSLAVKQFLDSRGDVVKHLDVILLATPPATAWEYKNPSTQTITVNGESAEEISAFVQTVSKSYSSVKIDSLTSNKDTGWLGVITVGGLKP